MHKRSISAAAAALLVFAACSSKSDSGPQTLAVQIDASAATSNVAFTSYFPNAVTAHPGDTVDFKEVFTGEPHTVVFGTLVDQGLPKASPDPSQPEPAELQKIPVLIPGGPGDAIQAAAQPCFLATGDPPPSAACSADQQKQPAFDGTQTFFSSGFLADGDQFKLALADTIKPGTYSYMCALHRGAMTGKIVVVDKDTDADSSSDVSSRANTQIAAAKAKAKSLVDAVKAGTLPGVLQTAVAGTAIAGGGAQDNPAAVPVLFGPSTVSIKAGETVTWDVSGPHTISFNPSEALRTFISKAPDGAVHLNSDSFAPAGGAGAPQGPPPTAPTTVTVDGGSYDGTGFHSSGLLFGPPASFVYKLKFTKAGTYPYICLVHPDMKGTINVT